MHSLTNLFEQNRAWAEDIKQRDPAFFQKLSRGDKSCFKPLNMFGGKVFA